MTCIGFAWVLNLSFSQIIIFLLYVVFVDFIFAGMISATIFWVIANKYLTTSSTDGDIEWGYSFDVHVNAFFPPLIILHFIQLFFYKCKIFNYFRFLKFFNVFFYSFRVNKPRMVLFTISGKYILASWTRILYLYNIFGI